ncbi:BTAD domain-containing putative transcriptional regulator [Actinomadura atramentaria]|uniref:BTAD domain-containing putative transcriptional regulator n=1 Tax=Actinomadura atramentaria TaxID=1990 RepID=UPI0003738A69|nr:BTAD domain-containing putative transcriptional regulator [Actinomadura atramentaria]
MRIGILGTLDVRDGIGRAVPVRGTRLRALLIRLALDPGRPVSADRLLDDLWDGDPPAGGGNALQAVVSRLRAAAGRDLVEHGPAGYRLAVDPAAVDAVVFDRAVAAARADPDPRRRVAALGAALDLWRGPALADVADADFAAAPVARLAETRLTAVEDRADAALTLGEGAGLVAELEPLVAANPLRERLRGLLMRALAAAGRPADALRVFEDGRELLADRLGADPSPELAAVHLALLRRESAPAREDEPEPGRRTNLPARFTTFVGREAETERVRKLVRDSRLVTLTGPGGAGKTRLSAEAAAGLLDDARDGVWFVPLASVSDGRDIPAAVLTALGVHEVVLRPENRPTRPALDRLAEYLAGQDAVLVLDNCEHLIDAVAAVVDRLLGAAPRVRVLATSREPLGITGEALCPVPSLPLPPAAATPADALAYASVRLFADRAAAVRPGFEVDAATAPDVVRICRALDGIPLAIELAAARLRSLTSAQVAERLDDRFRLLTAGSRTALPRHRTLRAVVDWSWDLLDDQERTVLRRLAVFAGGATPDAAAGICGGADARVADVVDVVAALVEKSLVMAEGDAEVRYRLLETVRVYAAERLAESGEERAVRDRHAAWYADFAERAEPELRRADQLAWADRLGAERDNCAAAMRHAVEIRDVPLAVRLVGSLAWFWFMRDLEREAGGWALEVEAIAGDTAPPGLAEPFAIMKFSARLVSEMVAETGPTASSLRTAIDQALRAIPPNPKHPALVLVRPLSCLFTADYDLCARRLDEIEDTADPWIGGAVHLARAFLALNDGRVEEAERRVAAGYAAFEALGDRFGMIVGQIGLMRGAVVRGDLAAAIGHGERAHDYAVQGVSPEQGAAVLVELGTLRARAGDEAAGRRDIDTGIARLERVGEFADAAGGHVALADLARRAGDLQRARDELRIAYEHVEHGLNRPDFGSISATVLSRLGALADLDGDPAAAAAWHRRAFGRLDEDTMISNQTVAVLVSGLALHAATGGDHERAAELLGAAHTLNGYEDRHNDDAALAAAAARAALGDDAFAAARERGRALPRETVRALRP